MDYSKKSSDFCGDNAAIPAPNPTHPTISNALNWLSGHCNHASTHDGQGFNKLHAVRGNELAALSTLDRSQHLEAFSLLQTYRNTQLVHASIVLPSEMEFRQWVRSNFADDYKVQKRRQVDEVDRDEIPEVLPGIKLNDGQWKAIQEIEEFLRGDEKFYLLTGCAGSGKSTILQAIVKRLRKGEGKNLNIVFTAPTNKATRVLQRMVNWWNLDIQCTTVFKLLGLKPEIDHKTGKQVFRQDYSNDSKIDKFNLVVIDESSMIGEELWQIIVDSVGGFFDRTQVLFCGDKFQLPPVNENEAKPFSEVINQSELTEVVRYGGSIGVLAEAIRTRINYVNLPTIETDTNDDRSEGIFALDRHAWEKSLLKAVQSDAYKEDCDYVRALAYTNKRVNALNQSIRDAIYGVDAPRFVAGERLMANSPVMIGDTVAMATSSECEVSIVVPGQSDGYNVWTLEVLTDEGKCKILNVLHESSQADFDQQLEFYRKEKRWHEFWKMKQLFADLSYTHAMTVHKCVAGYSNIFAQDGFVPAQNVCSSMKLHTGAGQIHPVVQQWGTGKKKIVRITTRSGYSIDVSRDHPLLVASAKSQPVWVKAENLSIGMFACIDRTPVLGRDVDLPDLVYSTSVHASRTKFITVPKQLNAELCWLVGVIIGNGHCNDRIDGRIEIASNLLDKDVHDKAISIVNRFGICTTERFKKDVCGGISFYFHSKPFRDWLKVIGLEYSVAFTKKTPQSLMFASLENRCAYLQGLFDTDGSVDKSGKLIRFVTISPYLASEVQMFLLGCGILSTLKIQHRSNENYQDAFTIAVSGTSLKIFHEFIGFSCKRKAERLARGVATMSNLGKTNNDFIPFREQIGCTLRECWRNAHKLKKTPEPKLISQIFCGNLKVNYRHLREISAAFSLEGIEVPQQIQDVLEWNYFYDPIKSIEFLESETEMFDIEMEEQHSFVANGFVCHNSQGSGFANVFLDLSNLMINKKITERNQLIYTGITRSIKRVFICQ